MNEHTHVDKLLPVLRSNKKSVVLKHADRFTLGVPDISFTLFMVTSWWEVKWADPDFESPGIQQLTCLRLAAAGICFYIIFDKVTQSTFIVHPRHIANFRDTFVARTSGYDYEWVKTQIEIHHPVK